MNLNPAATKPLSQGKLTIHDPRHFQVWKQTYFNKCKSEGVYDVFDNLSTPLPNDLALQADRQFIVDVDQVLAEENVDRTNQLYALQMLEQATASAALSAHQLAGTEAPPPLPVTPMHHQRLFGYTTPIAPAPLPTAPNPQTPVASIYGPTTGGTPGNPPQPIQFVSKVTREISKRKDDTLKRLHYAEQSAREMAIHCLKALALLRDSCNPSVCSLIDSYEKQHGVSRQAMWQLLRTLEENYGRVTPNTRSAIMDDFRSIGLAYTFEDLLNVFSEFERINLELAAFDFSLVDNIELLTEVAKRIVINISHPDYEALADLKSHIRTDRFPVVTFAQAYQYARTVRSNTITPYFTPSFSAVSQSSGSFAGMSLYQNSPQFPQFQQGSSQSYLQQPQSQSQQIVPQQQQQAYLTAATGNQSYVAPGPGPGYCRAWAMSREGCKFGSSCRYKHEDDPNFKHIDNPSIPPPTDPFRSGRFTPTPNRDNSGNKRAASKSPARTASPARAPSPGRQVHFGSSSSAKAPSTPHRTDRS